ncbi:MAG: hypothetical protein M1822_000599 [Bathelium mastoideum]|nr:MAG: hypothetical protein M1822_000599 [Bathelium mastoideum]
MAQQVNMAGMGSVGGPVGGPNMMSNGPSDPAHHVRQLNTYIYDYFLKNGHFDLARLVNNTLDTTNPDVKPSPRRDVNGIHDGMDDDSKDKVHKIPEDLPRPKLPQTNDNSFLLDWWSQFWDVFSAQRNRIKGPAQVYLQHSHGKNRLQQQQQQQLLRSMEPQVMGANMAAYRGMPQNAMMTNELQRRAFANQRTSGQNLQNLKQQQMLSQSGQMQREGSAMGMGQDHPQSPGGSVDNAPSPKRPRLEGNGFNGPMGPAGRGQPQGMQGQGIPNVGGMPQGSPMNGQQGPDMNEFYAAQRMAPGMTPASGNNTGNHALQDYQMQLMLLEQQNKKRLLMARQEQDSGQMGHAPAPGAPGQGMQQAFPPGVSPQARPGPSPNPADQMKRATPKMGQSPLPDATMPQQGSPAANFDPSQIPQGVHPQFYNQMKGQPEGMTMGPGGQIMRPPSSNPAFSGGPAGMTQEMMQHMQQQRARMQQAQQQASMQNGMNFPPGAPQNMMQQPQPGQQGQPPATMGTPQQRNNMGPPPAPPAGSDANRTQPSSPAQSNQPPTPSPANKTNPKKKNAGKDNKQNAAKKGGPATTATSEAPDATPPTPITPVHANSFNPQAKNGTGPQQAANTNAAQPPATAAPQPPQPDANAGAPFGDLGNTDLNNLSLDFAPLENGPDVLQDFDFDSFLQHGDDAPGGFSFDPSFNFGGDGLEASTGE